MYERRYPRIARVNELVREVLADELERLSDPRLGFVTITGCEVSPDLRQANVYYTVLGGDEESHRDTAKGLRCATAHLKATLGRSVRMKYIPDLIFKEDPAIATGARVEEIIRSFQAGPSDEGGESA